jgi:hypothetical protein
MYKPSEPVEPPKPVEPPSNWKYLGLWMKIKSILENLPNYFKSTLNITTAMNVTEIYVFGQALSYTIEEEVVHTLNDTKSVWDPSGEYCGYRFLRQPQSFPDVLLLNPKIGKNSIIMGIELKSWYLLAKEGEPSFRFKVTPNACAPQDLLVIVPWVLSNVVTGTPIILKPFVISARYVAEYRNYWWKHMRKAEGDVEIRHPMAVTCYPSSREQIDDEPIYDPGNNFGRLARTRMKEMDEWITMCKSEKILGIEIEKWIEFFRVGEIKFKEACEKQPTKQSKLFD